MTKDELSRMSNADLVRADEDIVVQQDESFKNERIDRFKEQFEQRRFAWRRRASGMTDNAQQGTFPAELISDAARCHLRAPKDGLLRFARNDESPLFVIARSRRRRGNPSLAAVRWIVSSLRSSQ